MPRLLHPAAAILVAAGAALLLALGASSGSAQAPAGERTLRYAFELTGLRYVDAPPRAPRPTRGDVVAFSNAAEDAAGARAGALQMSCTVTTPRRSLAATLFQCDGGLALRDGTIMVSGVVPIASSEAIVMAVTGGTGAYEGARGSIASVPRGEDASDVTVHLLG